MTNEDIYQRLMQFRHQDPKHYGLTSIALGYLDVLNYSKSKKVDSDELKWRKFYFGQRLKEVMGIYNLSIGEIAEYFRIHNYSLDFV
jgi:hypothetical protein